MSFRAGLLFGTLGAAVAAAVAGLREASWFAAFAVLFGSAALLVGPAVAGLARARPLAPWARALLVGLGLSGLVLQKLASVLMVATHHRPLGAVTFAALAAAVVAGSSLLAARVDALAQGGSASARLATRALAWLAIGSVLVLLVRAVAEPALARGLFDVALALGSSALFRLLPWPSALAPRLDSIAVPVWFAAIALALLGSSWFGLEAARRASPALAGPLIALYP